MDSLIINTQNTNKAISLLRKYTKVPIITKPISDCKNPLTGKPLSYLGATCRTENNIEIYLNDICPEESFIHEILHQILYYEGYPDVYVNEIYVKANIPPGDNNHNYYLIKYLNGQLASTIHHPEVFRRLKNDYILYLDDYYSKQIDQKLERFSNRPSNIFDQNQLIFINQQDILIGLDYYLWLPQSQVLFDYLKVNFPDVLQSLSLLKAKIDKVGTDSPSKSLESSKIIKEHIILYGTDKNVEQLITNIWRSLEFKTI